MTLPEERDKVTLRMVSQRVEVGMALDTMGGRLLALERSEEESHSLRSVTRMTTQTNTILGPMQIFMTTLRSPSGEDRGTSQRRQR